MIFDAISNLSFYRSINPRIDSVVDYLKKGKHLSLSKGKYEVGDGVFVILMEYDLKGEEDTLWEAHRKFYDIQIILEGEERIGYSEISRMQPSCEYVAGDDYQLFSGQALSYITLKEGLFVLFAPQDVHKTSICFPSKSYRVSKIVFKVLAED